MFSVKYLAAAAFGLYTVILMVTEWRTSQQFVRPYFSDLEGPVRFYGVNTTLSVSLLWGTGLLCAVAIYLRDEHGPWLDRTGRFLLSQIALFVYLGFDDRFLFHERAGAIFRVNDAWLMLLVGVAELFLLAWHRPVWDSPAARRRLLGAALAFGLMVFIDGAIPREWVLRLSLEDLSKTWSAFFLFLFGWEMMRLQRDRDRVAV